MRKGALYYPYFHVRSEEWLKVSALYWPHIYRLIPSGYQTRDSMAAKYLSEYAGILVSVDPGISVNTVSQEVMAAIAADMRLFASRYGIGHSDHLPEGAGRLLLEADTLGLTAAASDSFSNLAFLHADQLTAELRDALVDLKVAVGPLRPELIRRFLPEERSISRTYWPSGRSARQERIAMPLGHPADRQAALERWMLAPRRFVRDYITRISEDFASSNSLHLVTDQEDTILSARSTSPFMPEPDPSNSAEKSASDLVRLLGVFAVKHVTPRGAVQVKDVVKIRQRFGDEFFAFGNLIDEIAAEISGVSDIRDIEVLQTYLEDVVEARLIALMRALEMNLRSSHFDVATAAISVKMELPALLAFAGGAAISGHPMVAGAAAAAIGLVAVTRESRQKYAKLRAENAASSYLLHVASVTHARNFLQSTVGRALPPSGSRPEG